MNNKTQLGPNNRQQTEIKHDELPSFINMNDIQVNFEGCCGELEHGLVCCYSKSHEGNVHVAFGAYNRVLAYWDDKNFVKVID